MKDIKMNAVANMFVRLMNIFFPLITTGYLSRVLSKPLYGEINIANTYLNWFIPFATFGVYNYGIREISKIKNKPEKVNLMFSTLFYLSIFFTVLTIIFYVLLIPIYTKKPSVQLLIIIVGIQLVAQMFYTEWVNEALENYSFLFYKTLVMRVLMLVAIFSLVKDYDDIVQYAIILSVSQFLNYFISFLWIKKDIKLVKTSMKNYRCIIKPLFGLFLLSNAGMLYTNLDITFISKVGVPEQVAYYTNGQRIIMLISGVISGAISVSVPRLSYYLGLEDEKSYQWLIEKSAAMFSFFMAPVGMGLVVLGVQGTMLMYGAHYMEGGIVTQLFAFRAITWALEIIMGTQIILIRGFENKLSLFYITGGMCNLILDGVLYLSEISAPQYYILTTILSEYIVLIIEYRFIRRNDLVSMKNVIYSFCKYAFITIGFIPIGFTINKFLPVGMVINVQFLLNIIITIVICCIYYGAVLIVTQDSVLMEIVKRVKGKLYG